jgi:hypothetical protein
LTRESEIDQKRMYLGDIVPVDEEIYVAARPSKPFLAAEE